MRTSAARRFGAVLCLFAFFAPRAARAAEVTIEADPETPLELLVQTDESTISYVGRYAVPTRVPVYRRLCSELPCTVSLADGDHVLALAPQGKMMIPMSPIHVNGPVSFRASYEDRFAVRAAGGTLLGASLLGGLGLILQARSSGSSEKEREGWAAAGLVTMLVGGFASIPLLMTSDKASLLVAPISIGSRDAKSIVPNGLGLTLRF